MSMSSAIFPKKDLTTDIDHIFPLFTKVRVFGQDISSGLMKWKWVIKLLLELSRCLGRSHDPSKWLSHLLVGSSSRLPSVEASFLWFALFWSVWYDFLGWCPNWSPVFPASHDFLLNATNLLMFRTKPIGTINTNPISISNRKGWPIWSSHFSHVETLLPWFHTDDSEGGMSSGMLFGRTLNVIRCTILSSFLRLVDVDYLLQRLFQLNSLRICYLLL